jgi:hypothetical protein
VSSFAGVIQTSCAGIDTHKKMLSVCVSFRGAQRQTEEVVREYNTKRRSLLRLAGWVREMGVTHVAVESTENYWRPVFDILESACRVCLLNPFFAKQLPSQDGYGRLHLAVPTVEERAAAEQFHPSPADPGFAGSDAEADGTCRACAARNLVSWAGVGPGLHLSAGKRRGGRNPAGNPYIAIWHMLTHRTEYSGYRHPAAGGLNPGNFQECHSPISTDSPAPDTSPP